MSPTRDDLNPTFDALLTLYAEHGAAGVKDEPAFQNLCDEHERDSGFHRTRKDVEEAQANLEKLLHDQEYREQIRQALKRISSARGDQRGTYMELVLRGYARWWSDSQVAYFREASAKLVAWRDYFLSFTNYNPDRPDLNLLNVDHRLLISAGAGWAIEPPVGAEQNLLAKLINSRLQKLRYRGYYYPAHLADDVVEETLKEEAGTSFAFVQLVQSAMFQRVPNWCHVEFTAAASDPSRTLIFVMGEPRDGFIASDRVHEDLLDWHRAVLDAQAVVLEPAITDAEARQAVGLINKAIAGQVEGARARLYSDVPA